MIWIHSLSHDLDLANECVHLSKKCTSYITMQYVLLYHLRYMVDAADQEKLEASRNELHNLLEKPQLNGIPVSF